MRALLHRIIRWYLRRYCGGAARDGVVDGGYIAWVSPCERYNASLVEGITDAEYVVVRDALYTSRGWVTDYE